jgi:hypothetical protein
LTPQYFTLFFTKMDKYQVFFNDYHAVSDEATRDLMMKEFMLSLSPDEFVYWMKEGNREMAEALRELIQTKDPDNIAYAKSYVDDMIAMLKPKSTSVSKAA